MIATFTRFDLLGLVTTQTRRVAIPILFVIVCGIALPVPGLPIIVAALVVSVSASYPFLADERGLLDTLYAAAPLTRRSVVIGRYLTLLVFGAAAVAIGAVVSLTGAAIRSQSLGAPTLVLLLLIAFGILTVALAVQLPWFFALGYTKSRPMIYIPVAIISIVGFLAGQSGLFDGSQILVGAPTAASLLTVTVIVLPLGVGLLVASVVVASHLYARREL